MIFLYFCITPLFYKKNTTLKSLGYARSLLIEGNPPLPEAIRNRLLDAAADRGDVEQINRLLEGNPPIGEATRNLLLIAAADRDDLEQIHRLLRANLNPAPQTPISATARIHLIASRDRLLTLAAAKDDVEQIDRLVNSFFPISSVATVGDISAAAQESLYATRERLLTQALSENNVAQINTLLDNFFRWHVRLGLNLPLSGLPAPLRNDLLIAAAQRNDIQQIRILSMWFDLISANAMAAILNSENVLQDVVLLKRLLRNVLQGHIPLSDAHCNVFFWINDRFDHALELANLANLNWQGKIRGLSIALYNKFLDFFGIR